MSGPEITLYLTVTIALCRLSYHLGRKPKRKGMQYRSTLRVNAVPYRKGMEDGYRYQNFFILKDPELPHGEQSQLFPGYAKEYEQVLTENTGFHPGVFSPFIRLLNGNRQRIQPDDMILTHPDGSRTVMSKTEFSNRFAEEEA